MFALTDQSAFFGAVLPALAAQLSGAVSSAVREWAGVLTVATELGVSTFSRDDSEELRLLGGGDEQGLKMDASLRLRQADLTRLLFGSVELELLLLEPGVQLTCYEGNQALMVSVLQTLLGGTASAVAGEVGRPHVWWSDQI
jgi:hypothetical protein